MKTPREQLLSAFSRFTIEELDTAYATYLSRNDAVNAAIVQEAIGQHGMVQTTELANCGKLFKHRKVDQYSGRVSYEHSGDISAFLQPFTTPGITARFNHKLAAQSGMNAEQARAYAATQRTVTVGPGERVVVVKG